LKDKHFGDLILFKPHRNPKASVETSIEHDAHQSLEKAYKGKTFFWGLEPKSGDEFVFKLTPPVKLKFIQFASGNMEHPFDRLEN